MGYLRTITIVPKLGIAPKSVAESMETSVDTILRNIHRDPEDSLHLPAYRVTERDYRIYYQDLVDWMRRNYVGIEVKVIAK